MPTAERQPYQPPGLAQPRSHWEQIVLTCEHGQTRQQVIVGGPDRVAEVWPVLRANHARDTGCPGCFAAVPCPPSPA